MKAFFGMIAGLGLIVACATTEQTSQSVATSHDNAVDIASHWRPLMQVEDRFTVYLEEPAPARAGDIVEMHLIYVYRAGAVAWEGQEVTWQEYEGMKINCATKEVALGPRGRYTPTGEKVFADNQTHWEPVGPGTLTEIAMQAQCDGGVPQLAPPIPDSENWITEAQKRLEETMISTDL